MIVWFCTCDFASHIGLFLPGMKFSGNGSHQSLAKTGWEVPNTDTTPHLHHLLVKGHTLITKCNFFIVFDPPPPWIIHCNMFGDFPPLLFCYEGVKIMHSNLMKPNDTIICSNNWFTKCNIRNFLQGNFSKDYSFSLKQKHIYHNCHFIFSFYSL